MMRSGFSILEGSGQYLAAQYNSISANASWHFFDYPNTQAALEGLMAMPGIHIAGGDKGSVQRRGLVVESSAPRVGDTGLLVKQEEWALPVHSEDFSHTSWRKTQIQIRKNIEIAPNGRMEAVRISDATSKKVGFINNDPIIPDDNSSYVGSIFIGKQTGINHYVGIGLGFYLGSFIRGNIAFNPNNGAIAGNNAEDAGVVDFNANWWRVWVKHSNNNSGNTRAQLIVVPALNKSGKIGGKQTPKGSALIWGAEMKMGDQFTEYVPTQGNRIVRRADIIEFNISSTQASISLADGTVRALTKRNSKWVIPPQTQPVISITFQE